jgi:hypothetical protein
MSTEDVLGGVGDVAELVSVGVVVVGPVAVLVAVGGVSGRVN